MVWCVKSESAMQLINFHTCNFCESRSFAKIQRLNTREHFWILLDNDCSIRVYQSFVAIFQKLFLLFCMALCLMLSVIYYAQNYTGIIGWTLIVFHAKMTQWLLVLQWVWYQCTVPLNKKKPLIIGVCMCASNMQTIVIDIYSLAPLRAKILVDFVHLKHSQKFYLWNLAT